MFIGHAFLANVERFGRCSGHMHWVEAATSAAISRLLAKHSRRCASSPITSELYAGRQEPALAAEADHYLAAATTGRAALAAGERLLEEGGTLWTRP